ncbi:methyltransferase family protein [Agromyces italicus]|uniref:methyltransferase family protein n=1 Tax=Agromyces italicus TaxID=279572 RepID=UPI0003B41992|nr:isoprenylcysteine carboxylmethyltransferase family protein [Agromyces italicus]
MTDRLGRAYFGVQALAGLVWWLAVFTVPFVREATLGGLDAVAVAVLDVPLFVGASAVAALRVRAAAFVATGWTLVVTGALAVVATVTGEAGWGVLLMAAASVASAVALSLMVLGRVPTEWMLVGPFRFRRADATAKPRAHLAATAAQIFVFWGVFLGVVPLGITWLEQRWQLTVVAPVWLAPSGAVVFVLASALGIWSAVAMATRGAGTPLPAATANRLVLAGPYRFVRNPMAVAGIAQGVGVGLMLGSWLVVVYAIAGGLFWNFVVRPLEEAELEARFGEEFRRYRAAVRCWVPRRTGPTIDVSPS